MSPSSSPRADRVQGLLIALIGIVLLAIAGYLVSERHGFLSHAQRVPGVVKALNAGGSHPQIEFTTTGGEAVSYPQGGMIYGYQVGQPVEVFYQTEKPGALAVINDAGALWGTPALVGLIGLIFALAGLLKFSRGQKQPLASSLKGL